MHIHETLQSQPIVATFRSDPVPGDMLKTLIAAGAWAAIEHPTEPWRFTIVGEATKHILAQRYADIRMQMQTSPRTNAARLAVTHARAFETFVSKPTVVIASCCQQGDAQRRREDYAATICAIQNIQLVAWSEGIAIQLSISPIIFDPQTYALLGIDPTYEEIIGLLYIGYPAEITPQRQKVVSDVLRWTP